MIVVFLRVKQSRFISHFFVNKERLRGVFIPIGNFFDEFGRERFNSE